MEKLNLNTNVVTNEKRSSSLPDSTPLETINPLGATCWIVTNLATHKEHNLHFGTRLESSKDIEWCQKVLLTHFPFTDLRCNLTYSFSSVCTWKNNTIFLRKTLNNKPSDKSLLRNWTPQDVSEYIRSIALTNGALSSIAIVQSKFNVLQATFKLRHEQDGLSFQLPKNFFNRVMTPILAERDMTYAEWEKGKTKDRMPLSVATLLLADALRTIRSTRTKLLLCYYEASRDGLLPLSFTSCTDTPSCYKHSDFYRFTNPEKKRAVIDIGKRKQFVRKLKKIDPSLTDFPFKNATEIADTAKEIQGACLAILLAVTAMRISEAHSVKSDWLEVIPYLDLTGEWTQDAILKSKIIKTGGGIIAKRGLSPYGVEAVNVLVAMSWVDKVEMGLRLFDITYKDAVFTRRNESDYLKSAFVGIGPLRERLQNYYALFTERAHESVKEAYPDTDPHAFRHLKMEFSLRKFDGCVEEFIKFEFRHHGWHTDNYSREATLEDERNLVQNEYVQEVIKRILANNPDDKFVGPTIKKVRKLAEGLLDGRKIEYMSLEELDEFYEDMTDQVHSMSFNSYGICFVLKGQEAFAKCGIKDNIPQTGEGSSKICPGCSNYGANKTSHEQNLMTNKARWQATAESNLIFSTKLKDDAKTVVKNIEKIEAEMEASS